MDRDGDGSANGLDDSGIEAGYTTWVCRNDPRIRDIGCRCCIESTKEAQDMK
jgi:hypothetical protein